jgi:uncharacterized protein (DUF924 family)
MTRGEVDSATMQVLDFWLALSDEQQFGTDDALDREIGRRFGALRERVMATRAADWHERAETLLAAVIVLDQFSRNLFRDSPEAFSGDDLAVALTREAIGRGWDRQLSPEERAFLYMPLMHAEDTAAQAQSVAMFEALGEPEYLKYAKSHAEVIERLGRYPSRNAALGRESSAAERAYLAEGGGW